MKVNLNLNKFCFFLFISDFISFYFGRSVNLNKSISILQLPFFKMGKRELWFLKKELTWCSIFLLKMRFFEGGSKDSTFAKVYDSGQRELFLPISFDSNPLKKSKFRKDSKLPRQKAQNIASTPLRQKY